MSWFQDLAGKAENILNQIDQNAANVLHKTDDSKNSRSRNIRLEVQSEEDGLISHDAISPPSSAQPSPKPMMSLKKSASSASLEARRAHSEHTNERSSLSEMAFPLINSNSTSRRSSREDLLSSVDDEQTVVIDVPTEVGHVSGSSSMTSSLNLGNLVSSIKGKSDLEICRERLETMQDRANVAELEAESLRAELRSTNESFNKAKNELETKLRKVVQSHEELQQQISWSRQEADQAKNELQQYRSRAQSTLQMKETIIEKLQSASESVNKTALPVDSTIAHSIELEHVKSEKTALLQESRELSNQLLEARSYIDRLESVQKSQQNEFELKLAELHQNMKNEESKWRDNEIQNRSQTRELQIVRNEMTRLQSDFTHQLHAKETELLQLRASRKASSSNDFEQRVHSLTQSLVQKQTSLESVTADRNALRFQLEKIEHEHRDTMIQLRQQRPLSINMNDTDDAKARLPMFMQETPFDTRVSRRVKRVYSTLDSMGVRLGVFLRRYPLIRILTIFYVVLLHLWVMVVLCTTAPN